MKTNLNIVPLEIVKEILELGFDYEVLYKYVDDTIIEKLNDWTVITDNPAPMASTVLQWFREQKDITIFPIRVGNVTMPNMGFSFIVYLPDDPEPKYNAEPFETEEEAIIRGIKFTLEMIKQ